MKVERKDNMLNEDMQVKFTNYINEFKKQSNNIKREEIVQSLKEIISLLDLVCENAGIDYQYLKSNEIYDLSTPGATEDDYLEAYLVYIENIKNIISKYLLEK